MTGYTKLFGSIIHSTVWRTPHHVRLTWITMLAMCDQDGIVDASVPGLAAAAGVSITECEQALAAFLAPDPYSRSPEYEGRRIEVVDGGWRLLNHSKYKLRMSIDERREKDRVRQQRHREAIRGQSRAVTDVTPGHSESQPVAAGRAESDMQIQKQIQTQTQRERETRAPARVADPVPTDPVISESRKAEENRARLAPMWRERTGATPPELSALAPKAEVVALLAGLPDEPELSEVVRRFFDDPKMREKGWPISWLLRNPAQWSARSNAKGGYAPPRKHDEYEARSMTFDQLMKEVEGTK